jgi:hypothetical protein
MRIEKIPKKVFGSNEEFTILRLLHDNGYDKFKREELGVLLDVFNILPTEQKTKLLLEDLEYQIMEEYLEKNSINLNFYDEILCLDFLKLEKSKNIFRNYEFQIWFLELDENHLITMYIFEKHSHFNNIYEHKDFFEYKDKLYCISHFLDYNLIDDYPHILRENITNIIRKDKLHVYLRCLSKRYGDLIFPITENIDRFFNYIGLGKSFQVLKENFKHDNEIVGLSHDIRDWDINDLIKFLYLNKKQLKKEV